MIESIGHWVAVGTLTGITLTSWYLAFKTSRKKNNERRDSMVMSAILTILLLVSVIL